MKCEGINFPLNIPHPNEVQRILTAELIDILTTSMGAFLVVFKRITVIYYNEELMICTGMQGSSIDGANSVMSTTRMDNSYVVLGKQRPSAQGIPPSRGGTVQPETGQRGKAMEESFVVVHKSESNSDGTGTHLSHGANSSGHLQPHNSGFNSTITVLKRAFEIATTQTQVYI